MRLEGIAVMFWQHDGNTYMDWVKLSAYEESPETLVGHAYETLAEYEAQKRFRAIEGVDKIPSPEAVAQMTEEEVYAYGEEVEEQDQRMKAHRAWIGTNAHFLFLPGATEPPSEKAIMALAEAL